jgi:hypothetical protein
LSLYLGIFAGTTYLILKIKEVNFPRLDESGAVIGIFFIALVYLSRFIYVPTIAGKDLLRSYQDYITEAE